MLVLAALASVVAPAAHAACSVTLVAPADGSVQSQSPRIRWVSDCVNWRVRYSPSGAFTVADTVNSPWVAVTRYTMNEATWDGYQAGAWAAGVYVRVQGRDAAGVVTQSTVRHVTMDPNLDDDAASVAGGDCDDNDASVYPGAAEVCGDGKDNDCDGTLNTCGLSGTLDLATSDTLFVGEDAGDDAGTAVEIVRDLDGDGNDDVIVTGPDNAGGGTGRGAVYVFYGPVDLGTLDLSAADAKITGLATDDSAGDWVAYSGDLNGDGYGEIVVSIDAHETMRGTSLTGNGTVYVYYGPVYGAASLADADAAITGELPASEFGFSMSAQCDVNGDGNDDLIVGAPDMGGNGRASGAGYLLHGPVYGALSAADADAIFYGEAAAETAGHGVGCAGDLNGDGYDEVAIGGDENDAGGAEAGAVYLYYGPVTPGTYILSAATADAKLIGEAAGDGAGVAISGGSDLTGDGRDDLVIAAALADTSSANSGVIYVVDSPVVGEWDLSLAPIRLTGANGDLAGTFLSQTDDVNGDGQADLLVGARGNDEGGTDAGIAWLLYGPLATGTTALSAADLRLIGESAGDYAGSVGSIHGDTNGDGKDDILLGAPRNDAGGTDSGAAYLVLGEGG